MSDIFYIIIIAAIFITILINTVGELPYTINDHHNDIMKDYDEEKWIDYQKSDEFKKSVHGR